MIPRIHYAFSILGLIVLCLLCFSGCESASEPGGGEARNRSNAPNFSSVNETSKSRTMLFISGWPQSGTSLVNVSEHKSSILCICLLFIRFISFSFRLKKKNSIANPIFVSTSVHHGESMRGKTREKLRKLEP